LLVVCCLEAETSGSWFKKEKLDPAKLEQVD